MTALIAIMGLCIFRIGMWTSVDSDGAVRVCSPGLAGCGMAVFLGVIAAQVM